ncbi:TOM1-like protein 2 [Dendronephthya gigantea]|uniref:TOM1-like protein 2 n=1 Tax=Dendronephthya gigantea TaxID=151771 RepID=UPI00106B090E|nr:TOM1-like protein 2 [Dendronephthya gigantea]
MASFFSSNPFSSPVGQRIERATDEKLASEDWALNIEICDIINETDEGPKDAIKAIRKRLSSPRDFKVVMFTLTVLETCVKNCNRRFHICVATQDFLHELTKLLQPKYNAPVMIQDKILALIQTWADAFKGKPELDAVPHVYNKLKTQGIQFPAQDLDSFSPIYTPERSVPEQQPGDSEPTHHMVPGLPAGVRSRPATRQPTASRHTTAPRHTTGPRTLTTEKLAKLRSQLDVVQGNIQVMSEMLIAVKPGEESLDDHSLLMELNKTCRAMQTRIVQLLDQVGSEEVTEELLRVNDDLNNVFIRYDRYERNRAGALGTTQDHTRPRPSPEPSQDVVQLPRETETWEPNTAPLIDFDESGGNTTSSTQEMDERIARQFGDMGVTETNNGDEFDMFAQTRQNTFEDSRRMGSTYEDNSSSLPDRTLASAMHVAEPAETTENEGKEASSVEGVEDWLATSDLPSQQPASEQTSMTSSEFDAFLQQRAVSGGSRTSTKNKPGQRQMKKDVDESDEMFGL